MAFAIGETLERFLALIGREFGRATEPHAALLVPASVRKLAEEAAAADTVELELAVTAAFLAKNGYEMPWEEVASRKEGKATPERLARARALYANFRKLNLPQALPAI